jgi:hypothetical protein
MSIADWGRMAIASCMWNGVLVAVGIGRRRKGTKAGWD